MKRTSFEKRTWNIKAAIFDLDGTILDSSHIWFKIDAEMLLSRNIPLEPDYIDTVLPMDFRQAAEYTIKRFNLKESVEDILNECNQTAIEEYAHNVKLKPYAKEFIEYLYKRNMKLSIVTFLPDKLSIPALKNNDIYQYFFKIYSASDIPNGKESPEIYLKAAEEMNINPKNCILFDDVSTGIKGGLAAGMYPVGVYDKGSPKEKQKIIEMGIPFINGFDDLSQLFVW